MARHRKPTEETTAASLPRDPLLQLRWWSHFDRALRRRLPDLDSSIAAGQLEPVFGWMREYIWSQASLWETPELVRRASGEALNPQYFREHLDRRYLRC
jgi:Zn-dependent M32 family carboxypeptidase